MHRYLVVFGGRGSGKTNHIILKLLALTYSAKHVSIYYCRHQEVTIRKTTFKDICSFLENSELKNDFSYSTSYNSSMIFTNRLTGKQLIPFGLDDPEKTKGISEATHAWVDEADKCTEEQITMLNAVIRTPAAFFLQLILSFNPTSDRSWIRKFFFDEHDAYAPHPRFGDEIMIHHSTVYDNEYINVEAYVRNLQLMYGHSPNLININIKGLWGILENPNPFFYAYDEIKFCGNVKYMKDFPLIIAFDFNINPATCSLWQFSLGQFVHSVKSYKIKDCSLKDLCLRIKSEYPMAVYKVTGDPSGNNRNPGYNSPNETLYTIIKDVFGLSSMQIDQPKINYAGENYWREMRVFCNLIFQNHPNLIFNTETTIDLRHEIHIAKTEEGKDKLYKTAGPTEFGMNLVDGMIYFMLTYLTDYPKMHK
jgi:PBSX family phage terminase large subunit